ncbi:DUF4276 family protein [Conchiformibius kuhniae]|uniref:DUF4276 family protein n=1 Tax=Conchiformibius kuhniae TaxID=211502 RepID=A0A8T9MUZ2_9NEIS|nr:DUF4276 family protein [Conchiformibius kuhniae]UOP04675.1 DUF4276 family protein [Conchiformibius kuhniae]
MKTVIVLVEGQSEETFIRDVVAPAFHHLEIYLQPRCIPTSKSSKGGAVTFERFMHHARNTLNERQDTYVTTMLDLYGLNKDFPNYHEALSCVDIYQKAETLELGLVNQVIETISCRPERFVPYIQPYEFEGLLFSNVEILSQQEPDWEYSLPTLQAIRQQFETPEHINNSYDTKPSKRLEDCLSPKYRKTRHGPLIAKAITLRIIENECLHFHQWMNKLRQLPDL